MRTLGSVWLALQVQAQGSFTPDSMGNSGNLIVNLVSRSTVPAKVVILVLALFSVVSWGVILFKWWTFSRAGRQTAQFIDVFRRSQKFSEVQAVCRSLNDSPLVGLFQSGYTELTAQLRQPSTTPEISNGPNPKPSPGRPTLKSLTAVDRALMRASVVEVNKLEHWIPFLATTASVTPFIGLFGTVWGILVAFEQIGQTGSTSIAAVGPGISEALVTTALGLFAAIPAVMAYNYLTGRVKTFASEMDDFAMEFLNIAERNFT